MHKVEFKVRPVTRYIVSEYHSYSDDPKYGSSQVCGEFQNVQLANQACDALAHNYVGGPENTQLEIFYKLFSHDYDSDELIWVQVANPRYHSVVKEV